MFFFTKRSETEKESCSNVSQESNNIFNFGHINMEENQKKKESETKWETIIQDTEKDKKHET